MSDKKPAQKQNGSENKTSSERNAKSEPKTLNRKKVKASTAVSVVRKMNMVKYESSDHVLSLSRKIILSDGTTPMELTGKLNLTGLSEPERQRIIAVAKLITNWCSGHNVTDDIVTKKDDEEVKLPSPLKKVNHLLEKTQSNVEPVSDSTPEKG